MPQILKTMYILILIISIIISGAKNGQNGEEICQVENISEKDCLAIGCCRWNDTGYSLSNRHIFSPNNQKNTDFLILSDL